MKLCVITGEASGDLHAAALVRELRRLDPQLEIFGTGGEMLRAEGMRVLYDVRDLAIVGLFNVIAHLPEIRRKFWDIVRTIERERPDGVVLVDYPDFNLRLAEQCRRRGVPVYYYISPQVWAWRQGRVRQIAARVDHMLVLFPFEEEFYRKHGVPVTYVGHPLLDQLEPLRRVRKPLDARPLRIALMPGSRRSEVVALLPVIKGAALRIAANRDAELLLIRASTIDRSTIDDIVGADASRIQVIEEGGRAVLATCDISLCSSGTATLESAVLGVPPIVIYKLSRMTYALARRLVKVPHFSLVNIVAGREVVPELIQAAVTPAGVAAAAENLLRPERYAEALRDLDEVRHKLGESGASRRAAEKIYTLVTRPGGPAAELRSSS